MEEQPDLPDFDLNDEDVREVVIEAAGFYRGLQASNRNRYDYRRGYRPTSKAEARILMEVLLKSGMVSDLDQVEEALVNDVIVVNVSGGDMTLRLGNGNRRFRIPNEISKLKELR